MIKATNLAKQYAGRWAVKELSLSISAGEVLGLLGPNGAGKSTTMQMLTGNLAPTMGEVFVDGINMLEQPKQAKQHIGYLPEVPPLYRDATVSEFLRYCCKLRGVDDIAPATAEAMDRCGLKEVSRRLIGNLSKGFQQRVGIAQAILHQPKVIILDEPTVGLDPIQIREIRDLIRQLGESHAVILSTHILSEVQAVCDRVHILNKGETVLVDVVTDATELEQIFYDLVGDEVVSDKGEVA